MHLGKAANCGLSLNHPSFSSCNSNPPNISGSRHPGFIGFKSNHLLTHRQDTLDLEQPKLRFVELCGHGKLQLRSYWLHPMSRRNHLEAPSAFSNVALPLRFGRSYPPMTAEAKTLVSHLQHNPKTRK